MGFFKKDTAPVNTLLTDNSGTVYRQRDNGTWWSSDGELSEAPSGVLWEADDLSVQSNERDRVPLRRRSQKS